MKVDSETYMSWVVELNTNVHCHLTVTQRVSLDEQELSTLQ
jgi:hypothetical protein